MSLRQKIAVRVRQAQWALTAAPLDAAAWHEIAALLTPAELALFQRFSAAEQRHALRVLRRVQASGPPNSALYKAALLHDIGKTRRPLSVLDRILVVLGMTLLRPWAARLGRDPARTSPLHAPFVLREWHPVWGAALAAAAQAEPQLVALIRYHQTPPADLPVGDKLPTVAVDRALLARLQAADDMG